MKLNIKSKMKELGLSRYELAKRINVTYPTITAIYNGESTSVRFETLQALCSELHCTPNDIIVPDDNEVSLKIETEKSNSDCLQFILKKEFGTNSIKDIAENLDKISNISIDQIKTDENFKRRLLHYISYFETLFGTKNSDENDS